MKTKEQLLEERELLEQKIAKKQEKIKKLDIDIKIASRLAKFKLNKKRTHHLCAYGGIVEKYMFSERCEEENVKDILERIFNLPEVQNLIK